MLENDPPPGTRVALTEDVRAPRRTIKAYEPGVLIKALQPWTGVGHAEDRFLIRIRDEEVTVRRDQIQQYTL